MAKPRKWRNILPLTALIISGALFILVNILSNKTLTNSYIDFTDNKIYTLSQGTHQILKNIDEPILLRYYFSKKLAQGSPAVQSYAQRVQELLQQYQILSNGKINLQIIDPEPFSEAEDRAMHFGLQGVPIDGEGNELYFGLVGTNSTTDKEIISFFQPNRETYLEYDITQLVNKLNNPTPIVVGVISSLPMQGGEAYYGQRSKPWMIWNQLQENYQTRTLDNTIKAIPDDVNMLMLVSPKSLSQDTLYAIDQFALNGGHILAFVDPYSELTGPTVNADKSAESDDSEVTQTSDTKVTFNDVLRAWGAEFNPQSVLAIRNGAKQVRYKKDDREYVARYPLWIDLSAEQFNRNDITTLEVEQLTFASPGFIKAVEGSNITFTPLVVSGDDAMVVQADQIATYREDPQALMRDYTPDNVSYTLAARLTGEIQSAFSTGLSDEQAAMHQSRFDKANIVVVADSDLLQDDFWVSRQNFFGSTFAIPTSGNGNFVLGLVDNLSGSDALISVRNRGVFARPFTKVRDLQIESQEKYREREQGLMQKLDETKKALEALEKQKNEGNAILLGQQQKAAESNFRQDLVETRKELRNVRHELRRDIESLETRLKWVNIGLMPLMVILASFLALAWRRKQHRA